MDEVDENGRGGRDGVKGYSDDPLRHRWEHLKWLELKARMPEEAFVAFLAAERERREESRKLARRRIRPSLWHDGEKYYCMRELARLRGTTRANALEWARRRPSLCRWSTMAGGVPHRYCRHVPDAPTDRYRDEIVENGATYYSMRALAERHGTTVSSAWEWADRRRAQCIMRDARLYCRDEGYQPPVLSNSITCGGEEYFSFMELARRRRVTYAAVKVWAKRRPHLVKRAGRFYYAKDEPYRAMSHPQVIWDGNTPYFCMRELARRRGYSVSAAHRWTRQHPHLARHVEGHPYARDEEWEPRDHRETPERVRLSPPVSPWALGAAARRRSRGTR